MEAQLIRLMKAFCPDFRPVRRCLDEIGAVLARNLVQTDYFFRPPTQAGIPSRRRLKLRYENGEPRCLFLYDRGQGPSLVVEYKQFDICDPTFYDILQSVLGVTTVVQKRREVWHKELAVFNLDTVEGVGRIFEIELATEVTDVIATAASYKQLLGKYLGPEISGSNEDLVDAHERA